MVNCAKNLLISNQQQTIVRSTSGVSSLLYKSDRKEFDLSQPLKKFVPILRNAEIYAKAFGMLRALGANGSKGNEKAVYVIGVDGRPITKIGVSFDPTKRLVDLQSGHYRKLYIYAVLFCPTRKSVSIEQAALHRASEENKRLNGEWVEMSAEDALLLVLETARDNGWAVCDGQTWFENMTSRTYALAAAKRARIRY